MMAIFDVNGKLISPMSDNWFDVVNPNLSNIYNPASYNDNTKLQSNGVLVTLAGSVTSDYIDVSAYVGKYVIPQYGHIAEINRGVTITTYPYYTYICFYDSSKEKITFINAASGNYETARNPVQIPADTKYMRCSWSINKSGVRSVEMWQLGVFVVDSASGTIPFEKYYTPYEVKSAYLKQENFRLADAPHFYGKTWTLFGDSNTDIFGGHDWQMMTQAYGEYGAIGADPAVPWTDYRFATKIAREFGMRIDNRAKAGSNMCIPLASTFKEVCGIYMLDAFLDEIAQGAEQPEIITIAFGGNAYDNYIGTASDTSETVTASYYGATRYFIENLREHCPKASFGFVLPTKMNWGSDTSKQRGVPLAAVAIKSVCEEEGVPYIDMAQESGITAAMLPDGVHLSSHQANNLYYHAMRRFVMGL